MSVMVVAAALAQPRRGRGAPAFWCIATGFLIMAAPGTAVASTAVELNGAVRYLEAFLFPVEVAPAAPDLSGPAQEGELDFPSRAEPRRWFARAGGRRLSTLFLEGSDPVPRAMLWGMTAGVDSSTFIGLRPALRVRFGRSPIGLGLSGDLGSDLGVVGHFVLEFR
jgi:hypothetical protein